jgi:transketolase
MAGVMNGMALHGGTLPVGGTFLVFSDYMRGAVRLAALSEAKVIFSWTHDSVGCRRGRAYASAHRARRRPRAMPNLMVIRPADATRPPRRGRSR